MFDGHAVKSYHEFAIETIGEFILMFKQYVLNARRKSFPIYRNEPVRHAEAEARAIAERWYEVATEWDLDPAVPVSLEELKTCMQLEVTWACYIDGTTKYKTPKIVDAESSLVALPAPSSQIPRWSQIACKQEAWLAWLRKAGHPMSADTLRRRLKEGLFEKHPDSKRGLLRLNLDKLPPAMQQDDFFKYL